MVSIENRLQSGVPSNDPPRSPQRAIASPLPAPDGLRGPEMQTGPPATHRPAPKDDVILGAKGIADYMGCHPTRVYRMAKSRAHDRPPIFHLFGRLAMRPSTYDAWIAKQEAKGINGT